jgi:hypothetical protein
VAAVLQGAVPCAYNAPYDGVVLRDLVEWGRWLDPLVLVKGLDKYEKGKRLTDAAARRGIVLAQGAAHGAAADAMVAAMLLPVLIREAIEGARERNGAIRFQGPPHPTVRSWLSWQRDAALEQERDLVEYRSKSGSRDPVDCTWHRLEGVKPPAAAAPPPPRTAECQACGAPIVWVVTTAGARQPCDPPELRAWSRATVNERREREPSWVPGKQVVVVTADGRTVAGNLDPDGDIVGRESHYSSCPHASRFRGGER